MNKTIRNKKIQKNKKRQRNKKRPKTKRRNSLNFKIWYTYYRTNNGIQRFHKIDKR